MPDPHQRDLMLKQEMSQQVGGRVELTPAEQKLDSLLHKMKVKEMSVSPFPPAKHFFKVRHVIQKSPVFKLLQKMPKGKTFPKLSFWSFLSLLLDQISVPYRCRASHPQLRPGKCWLAGAERHIQTSLLHLLHVGGVRAVPILRPYAVPTLGVFFLEPTRHAEGRSEWCHCFWQQVNKLSHISSHISPYFSSSKTESHYIPQFNAESYALHGWPWNGVSHTRCSLEEVRGDLSSSLGAGHIRTSL